MTRDVSPPPSASCTCNALSRRAAPQRRYAYRLVVELYSLLQHCIDHPIVARYFLHLHALLRGDNTTSHKSLPPVPLLLLHSLLLRFLRRYHASPHPHLFSRAFDRTLQMHSEPRSTRMETTSYFESALCAFCQWPWQLFLALFWPCWYWSCWNCHEWQSSTVGYLRLTGHKAVEHVGIVPLTKFVKTSRCISLRSLLGLHLVQFHIRPCL